MRHGNTNDFESCVPKIDETYDNEDVFFDRQGFEHANPGFQPVKRIKYGRDANHLFNIQQYIGTSCCVPFGNYKQNLSKKNCYDCS